MITNKKPTPFSPASPLPHAGRLIAPCSMNGVRQLDFLGGAQ